MSEIEGYWPCYISIDGARYWDIDEFRPYKLQRPDTLLPSDSRYRHDYIQLLRGNEDASQRVKEELEENQRRDRKLRADAVKAAKKKKGKK